LVKSLNWDIVQGPCFGSKALGKQILTQASNIFEGNKNVFKEMPDKLILKDGDYFRIGQIIKGTFHVFIKFYLARWGIGRRIGYRGRGCL
jgi:hypothetical protein